VIAGGKEAQITDQMWDAIMGNVAYGEELNLVWRPYGDYQELSALNKRLERLFDELEQHLKRKLARYRRRR
jgi:RNAse (barnase) inhibitor barstar